MNNQPKLSLKMRVWAAVRNMPGMSAKQLCQHFKDENPTSVTSSLSVLDSNDLVFSKYSPKCYFTELEVYDQAKAAVRKEPKSKQTTLEELNLESVTISSPTYMGTSFAKDRIEDIFNTLSLNESRDLYQRLHTIFGGTSHASNRVSS